MDSPRDLLHIPQELRDKILSFVLPTMGTAPTSWDGDYNRKAAFIKDPLRDLEANRCKYENVLARPVGISTLAVNHQLRDETIELLKHLGLPGDRCYRLVIMLVKEQDLWPTWLYVPTLTKRVEELVATVRISGVPQAYSRSGFLGGTGGPPFITWKFWHLLRSFLTGGPLARKEADDIGVSVSSLVIDIRTPDVSPEMIAPMSTRIEGEQYHPSIHESFRGFEHFRIKTGIPYVMNPKKLTNFLVQHMESLLYMSYYTAEYGGILYERIGSIKFMLDGELHVDLDLSEQLARLPFGDSFGNISRDKRPAFFKAWKEKAYKSRKEFGLKTFPAVELE